MDLVNEFSQVLKQFFYTGSATLEPYQQSIIEFFAITFITLLIIAFIRFVCKLFSSLF